ncbi:MAG: hypothetical protein LE168_01515 [Endomicrobium sp.]|nr:hypothetical protein [Endomicrobium sp.]
MSVQEKCLFQYKNDMLASEINRAFIDDGIVEQRAFLRENDKLSKLSKK